MQRKKRGSHLLCFDYEFGTPATAFVVIILSSHEFKPEGAPEKTFRIKLNSFCINKNAYMLPKNQMFRFVNMIAVHFSCVQKSRVLSFGFFHGAFDPYIVNYLI